MPSDYCLRVMSNGKPCGRPIYSATLDVDPVPVCLMHSTDVGKNVENFKAELKATIDGTSQYVTDSRFCDCTNFFFPPSDFSTILGSAKKKVRLGNAKLRNTNLRGVHLLRCFLEGADLFGADLREAKLAEANLNNAQLVGADFQSADIREALLVNTDLSEANLSGANLERADLWQANLEQSDLSGASLRWANLKATNLERANVTNVQYNRWSRYHGIRVATCYGSPRFRKFAQDQEFIEELRSSWVWFPGYVLWLILADCGRSLSSGQAGP